LANKIIPSLNILLFKSKYYNITNMSKRIPAKFKAQLGELLAGWYSKFGKVTPRRAYHEDDEDGGKGSATLQMFEEHPFLAEVPIGASSDLASVIVEDSRTLDEADKRSEDLTEKLRNELALKLGQKLQQRKQYNYQTKPQPF
jgi:hypothetical protein